jgi:CHAD domain-containing protein
MTKADIFEIGSEDAWREARARIEAEFSFRDLAPARGSLEVWDTFDALVWKAGCALLARGARWEFGARQAPWRPCSLARRSDERFAWDFPAGEPRDRLAAIVKARAILPGASLAWSRRTTEILDAVGKIVCRLDCEEWTSPAREAALQLVVIRPLRGYDAEAARLRELLSDAGEAFSESDRFLHALERLGEPVSGAAGVEHVPATPVMPAREAVSRMAGEMLRRARACEAGVCDDIDTEFLHDYRVYLRKARSVLALLKGVFPAETTERLKRLLGDMARRTNRLRDADVYLHRRAEYESWLPAELRAGLEPLFPDFEVLRATEQRAVSRYLHGPEYRAAVMDVERVLAHPEAASATPISGAPVGPLIQRALARRYRRIVRLAREIDHETTDEAIHDLRIQGKKLRYLLEFTRDLVSAEDRARLEEPLRRLQNRLGAFNDFSVQRSTLLAHARNAATPDAGELLAVGGLAAVLHERQTAERAKILARLRAFCGRETRRWVRERFAAASPEEPAS